MNIKIYKKYGRLGNNIFQLVNALAVGLHNRYNIILSDDFARDLTKDNYISLFEDIDVEADIVKLYDDKMRPERFMIVPPIHTSSGRIAYDKDNICFKKLIVNLRNILKIPVQVKPVPDNHVMIHLRGGDIFDTPPANTGYLPPPLSYYTDIIDNIDCEKITIISEDRNNPCLDALLERYNELVSYEQDTVDNDVIKLLQHKTVIMSYGTFVLANLLVSDNIKTLYMPHYGLNMKAVNSWSPELYTNIDIKKTDLRNYQRHTGSVWRNTPEQLHNIIKWPNT